MTHRMKIIGMGEAPAALCKCGKWGFALKGIEGDTDEAKKNRLLQAHAEHVQAVKKGKQ